VHGWGCLVAIFRNGVCKLDCDDHDQFVLFYKKSIWPNRTIGEVLSYLCVVYLFNYNSYFDYKWILHQVDNSIALYHSYFLDMVQVEMVRVGCFLITLMRKIWIFWESYFVLAHFFFQLALLWTIDSLYNHCPCCSHLYYLPYFLMVGCVFMIFFLGTSTLVSRETPYKRRIITRMLFYVFIFVLVWCGPLIDAFYQYFCYRGHTIKVCHLSFHPISHLYR